jgi:hypothetical protein
MANGDCVVVLRHEPLPAEAFAVSFGLAVPPSGAMTRVANLLRYLSRKHTAWHDECLFVSSDVWALSGLCASRRR